MYQNEFPQEFEQAIGQELETGGPALETFEFDPEYLGETSGEASGESFESDELNETFEMELAHELLEVSNELELNQFLGSLVKKVGGAVGNFAKSSMGRAGRAPGAQRRRPTRLANHLAWPSQPASARGGCPAGRAPAGRQTPKKSAGLPAGAFLSFG